ncbi:C-type lectin domain family 1 member B isoform X2 [Esox lucius]|uniref:C-type lectin domain-containing protein n=1 Tax=Esox lucius TaxID=8010 RepID=A0AAY5KXY1_ESOLU|nr:C-type lectin domain family 1 member B isoform X2 [Esox lucius]
MELHEITGKMDRISELEESKRVLETSVEERGSPVSSKQKSASENISVETSPGQLLTTVLPAESTVYSKLSGPSEDIDAGSSADWASAASVTVPLLDPKVWNKFGVYRALCLMLSFLCLALLVVVIILSVKSQSQPPVCNETVKRGEAKVEGGYVIGERNEGEVERSRSTQVCNLKKCKALYWEQLNRDCEKCEKGWLHFESYCYFLSRNRMTWNESREECQKRKGDLVVIDNQRLQTFLTNNGNLLYWIGLRQRTGTWVWVNNTVLGQSYWSESSGQYDCGLIMGRDPPERSWKTSPCHISTFYICQRGY